MTTPSEIAHLRELLAKAKYSTGPEAIEYINAASLALPGLLDALDEAQFALKHNAQTCSDVIRIFENRKDLTDDVLADINPGDYANTVSEFYNGLENERDRLKAKLEEAQEHSESLERDCATQVYHGNSVGHWHSKATAYGNTVLELHRLLAKPNEDVRDGALRVIAERDQALADLAAVRSELEEEKCNHACTATAMRVARAEAAQWKELAEKAEREAAYQRKLGDAFLARAEKAEAALMPLKAANVLNLGLLSILKELERQFKERGGKIHHILAPGQQMIEWPPDAARAQAKEMAGLLREIRQYMHSDHVSDSMLVRFTRVHLTRIDATLAAYDKEIK